MYYRQIDGLRFYAVTMVVLHHICPFPFLKDLYLGEFGVNLFFVISGFLITEILINEKIKKTSTAEILKTFFKRRVLRIFPLYYLYILICFFLVPDQVQTYISWLLTYTINIWMVIRNESAFWYFTHLWSLDVEEQFYIFWPFLIILFSSKRFTLLFSLMIILAIIYRSINVFFLSGYELFNYVMLPTSLDCLGAGALLAYLKIVNPVRLNAILKHKYFIVVAVLVLVLNNKFGTILSHQSLNRALNAFIAFYLVGISSTFMFDNKIKAMLENKFVVYFGRVSYGIYVYHLLIWGVLGKYFTEFWHYLDMPLFPATSLPKMFFEFLFILICTIICSVISYELFEKRFLVNKR